MPLLLGKYYMPVIEDRIFMFIDLHASTTHAEKLGHIKFSRLIQECFFDLNQCLENNNAELDQYIGDEAVITWKVKTPQKNFDAVRLFYEFTGRLKNREEHYVNEFGFLPRFKAGINCGPVTAVEIGVVKNSITYHGDVLNTTARIQGECNTYSQKLLLSEEYLKIITLPGRFNCELIGTIQLKGKISATNIYAMNNAD
jgi:adenylate cyclase